MNRTSNKISFQVFCRRILYPNVVVETPHLVFLFPYYNLNSERPRN
jgi:hypothetical protein